MRGGRGAFCAHGSGVVRLRGAHGRENVGMSSRNPDENSGHRKPKVSWATKIVPGLVGPKARPV